MRVMFYLVGVFRTASLGDSTSSNSERTALRMWGEEPGYVEVLQQRAGSSNVRSFCKLKKTRYVRIWVHWNHSFDMHLSYLRPVSCNSFANNTRDNSTHRHHQMVNTIIRFIILIICFAAKMEKFYTVSKNKTRSWLWFRSWSPYC